MRVVEYGIDKQGENQIEMAVDAQVLAVFVRDGKPRLYAAEKSRDKTVRTFLNLSTNKPGPDEVVANYIGSYNVQRTVNHVFEKLDKPAIEVKFETHPG